MELLQILFDKWDISPVVYRVQKEGKSYKGAVDQFIEKSITDEMKEEYNKIFDNLYYVFTRILQKIEDGR